MFNLSVLKSICHPIQQSTAQFILFYLFIYFLVLCGFKLTETFWLSGRKYGYAAANPASRSGPDDQGPARGKEEMS